MDFSNMNIWCWLIPLLCTLLGAIFGYYLGKSRIKGDDNSADLKLWQDKNAKLQADLDACNGKLSAKASASVVPPVASFAAGAVAGTASNLTSTPSTPSVSFDATAAKAVFGKNIKQDDLKVVEGIGPKIESMFKDGGIKTWKALSEAAVSDCQKILDTGGTRYKIHDPASWPMQSKMAYEGKWAELSKWQDEHKHGKL